LDYKKLDDETLIRLVTRSHSEALSELYDRFNRLVFGLALNAVHDQGLAEEITQDVFMRVWDRAGTYHAEQGKVATWVASITRNRAIDILRYQKIRPEGSSLSLEELPYFDPPDSQSIEVEVELNSQKQLVRRSLSLLPKEQRDALALAFFKGYTQQEVAEALGEPLGTVKTRIRLGMQKLRQILEEERP